MNDGPCRVWALDDGEWRPGLKLETLDEALAAARDVSQTTAVSIEINAGTTERAWYQFPETRRPTLGPHEADLTVPDDPSERVPRRHARATTNGLPHAPTLHLDRQLVRLVDVSEAGLRVVVARSRRPRPGDVLSLAVVDRKTRLDILAKVVWVSGTSVGLSLIWQEDAMFAQTYIRRLAKAAADAERRRRTPAS